VTGFLFFALVSSSNWHLADVGAAQQQRRREEEDVMQGPDRLHPQFHIETEDPRPALMELRRRAWETLLDLGLTEDEIAAYYGIGEDDSREAWNAGLEAALRQGIPVR
jgi:hypothetical protein